MAFSHIDNKNYLTHYIIRTHLYLCLLRRNKFCGDNGDFLEDCDFIGSSLKICVCVCIYIYIYIHTYILRLLIIFKGNSKQDKEPDLLAKF